MAQPQRSLLSKVALPSSARGLLCGTTGSGKSTMGEKLMDRFLRDHLRSHLLILDSKPRFRAEWEIKGISAGKRYKNWKHGPYIPGSFALDLAHPETFKRQMDIAFKAGSRVVIAQAFHKSEWPLLTYALDIFYEKYSAKKGERLVYVDELMDYFRFQKIGDSIVRVLRSGRELDIALLAATQRPKWIPVECLTELSLLYLFELDSHNDVKALQDNMGLPSDIELPAKEHSFLFYSKKLKRRAPSGRIFILSGKAAA